MLNEILNFRLLKREVKIISDFEVHASKFKVKATKKYSTLSADTWFPDAKSNITCV